MAWRRSRSGITAVVLALVQSDAWASGATAALALAGLLALLAFWRIERRVTNPIVDFELFRNGPYFGASAAAFALVGAYWAVMFFQPQYLQDVRGHSPIAAGVLILPVTVPMIFVSPFSGRLIGRFGARRLMTAGMACGVAGLLLLTQIAADSPFGLVLGGYLLFGIALGLVYAPMSTAAMAAMPGRRSGSPPACWRWTGSWPAPSRSPPPAPSSTLYREAATPSRMRSPTPPGSRWRSAWPAQGSPGPSSATPRGPVRIPPSPVDPAAGAVAPPPASPAIPPLMPGNLMVRDI